MKKKITEKEPPDLQTAPVTLRIILFDFSQNSIL